MKTRRQARQMWVCAVQKWSTQLESPGDENDQSNPNQHRESFSVHSENKKEATVGRLAWRVRSPIKQSSFLGISEGARLDPPLTSPRL